MAYTENLQTLIDACLIPSSPTTETSLTHTNQLSSTIFGSIKFCKRKGPPYKNTSSNGFAKANILRIIQNWVIKNHLKTNKTYIKNKIKLPTDCITYIKAFH